MQYCTPFARFRIAIIIKTAVTMVLCSQSSALSLLSSTKLFCHKDCDLSWHFYKFVKEFCKHFQMWGMGLQLPISVQI